MTGADRCSFGTFFFFQAAAGRGHRDIIHRELEQMVWAEELGFDSVWLTEHHFIDYGLAVDPAALAAAAASRTRRVRIGLAAAILPFHHPLRLAEQIALIDIICGGRLDVGVGRGNRPREFRGYTSRRRRTASASTRPPRSCCARGPRSASPTGAASTRSRRPG